MYTRSLFWFRQDLRVYDNTGLFEAVQNSKEVLPIFILDSRIIEGFGWVSNAKFWFIREALEDVSQEIKKLWWDKLIVFHGKPEEIISQLVQKYKIECVFTNTSYGSYGKKRDEKVSQILREWDCHFSSHKDFLIAEPHEIEQRKVFTPYYKLWQKYIIENPQSIKVLPKIRSFKQLNTKEQSEAGDFISSNKHPYFTMDFGRERFAKLPFPQYSDYRNDLDKDGTSRISPYLRFGIFSVRQIYNAVLSWDPQPAINQGEIQQKWFPEKWTHEESFISEMAWREFWWQIFYNFPDTKIIEFQEKRRHIPWSQDTALFHKWKQGETGYPIVDAAMKQLKETHWMHGRARMIVASFLTKDMHLDWRLGEAYFREMLLDYDEAVNLGNWQWWASVGADPKPLRIFNPLLQSEKFDSKAVYIKKYLPELEHENAEDIHNPLDSSLNYHAPIVDHRIETKIAREMYKIPE